MIKQSKLVYIIGSVIIGIVSVLSVITGLIFGGIIDGSSRQLVFTSGSIERVYDGTVLECDTWQLKRGELKNGHTAVAVVTGSQLGAGSSENNFVIQVYDTNGADVTDDYEIVCLPGTLTVNKRKIELVASSGTHVYDGNPYFLEDYTLASGTIVDGEQLNVEYTGEITNVGSCDNVISATVTDDKGNDLSANYQIVCTNGTLTVDQRPITLESFNKSGVYDGKPLCTTEDEFTIEHGELVSGHVAKLTVSGSQTIVGTSDNTYSAIIYDADDNDVTSNYLITSLFGTLTVTERRIEITSLGDYRDYNGEVLANTGWDITLGELAPDQTAEVLCNGEQLDVGSTKNTFSYTIKDANGDDVSANYIVEEIYGDLIVDYRHLHINTASEDRTYNGEALSNRDYDIEQGYSLAPNEIINILDSAKVTNVREGSVYNYFNIEILNGDKVVTSNYQISYTNGKLTVNPALLTVETGSKTSVYNGTPITNTQIINPIGIVSNNTYTYKVTGEQTNVGSSTNSYELIVNDSLGYDSITNYNVVENLGTIKVTPRPLNITTNSKTEYYTGDDLYDFGYHFGTGESVASGQQLVRVYDTKIYRVDQGEVDNKLEYVVRANGNDVTSNYEISYTYGKLQVLPVPLKITTSGITDVYDGKPLTQSEGKVEGVVAKDTYTFRTTGTRTDVGSSTNYYYLRVLDKNNQDSLSNYTVEKTYGIIKVTPRPLTINTPTVDKVYDGEDLYAYGNGIDYTDLLSVGQSLADGQKLVLKDYTKIYRVDQGTVQNNLSFVVQGDSGNVTSNYAITYVKGTLTVNPAPLQIVTEGKTEIYNGKPLTNNVGHITGVVAKDFYNFEIVGTQTDVGITPNYYNLVLLDKNNDESLSNYTLTESVGDIEVKPRQLTINTPTATKAYDGDYLYDYGNGTDFTDLLDAGQSLAEEQRLSLTNYSRIYKVAQGKTTNTLVFEVRNSNFENVTDNYEISYNYGTLEITPATIKVVTGSKTEVYNGKYITHEEGGVEGVVANDTYTFKVTGSRKVVGTSTNNYSLVIRDKYNAISNSNYAITTELGTIEVKPRPLTINTPTATKVYDGEDLYAVGNGTDYTDLLDPGQSLAEGQNLFLRNYTKIYKASSYASRNSLSFIVQENGVAVTSNYAITYKYGTLQVTRAPLKVTTETKTEIYNGKPITHNVGTVEGIVANDTYNFEVVGSRADVGSSVNSYNLNILDKNNVSSNSNYIITNDLGSIIVSPRPLTINTPSATKAYDGEYLFAVGNGTDYTDLLSAGQSLAEGQNLVLENNTKIYRADQGLTRNVLAFGVQANGVDVTGNYVITYNYGTLQVTRVPLKVTTETKTEVYNGKPITHNVGGVQGVVANDSYTLEIIGSLTNVGRAQNTYRLNIVDKFNEDSLSNYLVTNELGYIEVTKRPLTITTPSVTKAYDGEYLYSFGNGTDYADLLDASQSLAEGQNLVLKSYARILRVDDGFVNNELDFEVQQNGIDVTKNYDITYVVGTLKVTPVPLKVTTESKVETYNGQPITHAVGTVEGIVSNDTYTFNVVGTRTSAGVSDNEYELIVEDRNGTNSLSNYVLTKEIGTIEVLPINITVKTPDITHTYDTFTVYGNSADFIIIGEPAPNETFSFDESFTMSRTEVGKTTNLAKLVATKQDGTTTTSNYKVTYVNGTITVNPIELVVYSGSTTLMYNASEQAYEQIGVQGGLLTDLGHTLDLNSVIFRSGFINVGTYDNVFDRTQLVFVDENGQDVSSCYKVTADYGEVIIYPKPIEIRTLDATKEYDGTPLYKHEYKLTQPLIAGHELDITVTGTRTPPGESPNTFIVNDIIDTNGTYPVSVYANYEITSVYGVLYVFGGSGSGSGGEDIGGNGGDLSNEGEGQPTKTPLYEVNSSVGGRIYLREASYGDYIITPEGASKWLDGRVYAGGTINPMSFPYNALKDQYPTGQTVITRLNENAPYVLPYYTNIPQGFSLNDVIITSAETGYTVTNISYLLNHFTENALQNTTLSQEEIDYRAYVQANYLHLPTTTEEDMLKVIEQNGLDASANILETINAVANLVSNHVPYSYEYKYEGDIASYFFFQAKTAICQHYATAATALFRALDIPARYTTGYVSELVQNEATVVYSPGHAWVEVYVDGFGWVPVEVTGSDSGQGDDNQGTNDGILVKPKDIYVQGDMSTSISYTEGELVGSAFAKLCQENGYTYTFTVEGSQRGIGKSSSTIKQFNLFNSAGEDITDQYKFNFKTGVLHVYKQEITVMTGGLNEYYDGQKHSVDINSENAYIIDYGATGELISGHSLGELAFGASIKDVGSIANTFSKFSIVDASGNDVSDFYKINFIYGKLTIKPRSITIVADSAEATLAELNGSALTCSTYTYYSNIEDVEALAPNQRLVVTIVGSQSTAGRSANQITKVAILDENGVDVTKNNNYNINSVSGILRVKAN